LSTDRKHILVDQDLGKEDRPLRDQAWCVFSLETGKQLGKIPFDGAVGEMTVLEREVFCEVDVMVFEPGDKQRRLIKARDLNSGKLIWQHELWLAPILPPLP